MGTYTYGATPLHGVTATTNGYTASYDAAGDMTCRAVDTSTTCVGSNPTGQTMGYDALRELLTWQNTATNPTQTASYAYDGEGHRVQQTVTNNGTTTTTTYVGNYEEASSVSGGATTTTKYYNAGPVQAVSVNGTIFYLVNDGLGSVSASPDSASLPYASMYPGASLSRLERCALSRRGRRLVLLRCQQSRQEAA